MGNPPEALWRIYGFDLSDRYPAVLSLQLHLSDMHMVSFHRREGIQQVLDRSGADKSMLIVYFKKNRTDEIARGILYQDFPEFYTWQAQGKVWQNRARHDSRWQRVRTRWVLATRTRTRQIKILPVGLPVPTHG